MNKYLKYPKSNYDKYPSIKINTKDKVIWNSYSSIIEEINKRIVALNKKQIIVALDFYYGVDKKEIKDNLIAQIKHDLLIDTTTIKKSENETLKMLAHWLTNDRIFGFMSNLKIEDFFDAQKLLNIQEKISKKSGITIIYNVGASYVAKNADLIIYFDMARWEIQMRQRAGQDNWNAKNFNEDIKRKYKRSYFIEWRVFDKHKQEIFESINYWFDNNIKNQPKLVRGDFYRNELKKLPYKPFRIVPFFDPGVWGGQWMKEVFNLDKSKKNYAWCFDAVPEENSLYLEINNIRFETPSINAILYTPEELLGEQVYTRFGAEFPIRSDLLDNVGGQNLSLHVHPLVDYMYKNFGLPYTQDESYYILDGGSDQSVYLGFKNDVNPKMYKEALIKANQGKRSFDAEKYINHLPCKPHQHFMIPAGTPHCSGKNTMVLEISATPYIFTLRMWDWDRVDFDGLPRAINIDQAMDNLQFKFNTEYTKKYLIPQPALISKTPKVLEEKTGLHHREFIETRRFTFSKEFQTSTGDIFNLLNLVKGYEVTIKSINNQFEPFILHYGEALIMPAKIKEYIVVPYKNEECILLKSFVRF